MRARIEALSGETFDFLVIGGGIQGAALAREAALAGCSVLLVEKDDFGSATSSSSSRLIHGGLRYLEQGNLSLVREALHERERLLRLAPHLVRPLPMLLPHFKGGSKRPFLVKAGLKLYDLLAGRQSLPKARSHTPDECIRLFPQLRRRDLRGGSLYYDARTVDQRLTLAVVEAAHAAGARVANHLRVESASTAGILLVDSLRQAETTVRAKHVLNAAGPEVDRVRALLGVAGPDLVRLSRGSHLVLDPVDGEVALAAFLPDRRIQFVIPHPDGTICGTTEVVELPGQLSKGVPAEDVDYLIDALGYLYESPPTGADVRSGYIGWRALPTGQGPAGGASREAFFERERGAFGDVLTLVGGKLTTHRAFAERTVRDLLGRRGKSASREQHLPGGDGPQEFGEPLWWRHGSRAAAIRALGETRPDLLEPICPHRQLLRAEAVFALRHQATMTFSDLMRGRLFHALGPCLEASCLDDCHRLFVEYLPEGAVADPETDKAGLVAAVRARLGAAALPRR